MVWLWFVDREWLRRGGDACSTTEGAGDELSLGMLGYFTGDGPADTGVIGENREGADVGDSGVIGDGFVVLVIEEFVKLRLCLLPFDGALGFNVLLSAVSTVGAGFGAEGKGFVGGGAAGGC